MTKPRIIVTGATGKTGSAVTTELPGRPEEAMRALDGAIMKTEQVAAESRDAIKDLRS
jgi:uncharacterized protein YbjT (DUF2867 family)